MTRLREPFERLEPPAGGLAALRRRLGRHDRQLRRRSIAVAISVGVAGAACIVLLATVDEPQDRAPTPDRIAASLLAHPAAVSLGIAPELPEPVVATGSSSAMRVDTGDDDVVFYLVAAAPPVSPSSRTPASDPASSDPASQP